MTAAVVNAAFFGWFVVVLILFHRLPKARALVIAVIGGVLLLPVVYILPTQAGMPPPLRIGALFSMTKDNVVILAALAGALATDARGLLAFRPRWFDVPMLVWCFLPLISDYLADDPLNVVYGQTRDHFILWGLPYLLGRIYLCDCLTFLEASKAVLIGALAYTPLCVFEIVKSPYLHWRFYGYFQHSATQTYRFGGYRPMVFLNHGLELGLWMTAAALLGWWLWQSGALRGGPHRQRTGLLWTLGAAVLVVLAALVKSSGALFLGAAGVVALHSSHWLRVPVAVLLLFAVPVLYMEERISDSWSGRNLVSWLRTHFDPARAQSLEFRFANEQLLIRKSLQSPWLGWGNSGEAWNVPRYAPKHKRAVPDGLWILTFGSYGIIGLIVWQAMMLLPSALFLWRFPAATWLQPMVAPLAATAVLLALFNIDCLMNNMMNPVYLVLAGGLASVGSPVQSRQTSFADSAPTEVELPQSTVSPVALADPPVSALPPGVRGRRVLTVSGRER
jgi:hypothetical protein